MSKELATTEPNNKELAAISEKYGSKTVQNLGTDDVEIKRMMLAQGTSDVVQDDKGIAVGNFYSKSDSALLGTNKDPAEMIVVWVDKVWKEFNMVYDEEKDRYVREYSGMVAVTEDNADLPTEDKDMNVERDFAYQFYMLSAKELKDGACIPYLLSLSRTGIQAAKSLNNKLVELAARNLPPFTYAFAFTSEAKSRDKDGETLKWQAPVATMSRTANELEMVEADRWYDIFESRIPEIRTKSEEKEAPKKKDDGAEVMVHDVEDGDCPI